MPVSALTGYIETFFHIYPTFPLFTTKNLHFQAKLPKNLHIQSLSRAYHANNWVQVIFLLYVPTTTNFQKSIVFQTLTKVCYNYNSMISYYFNIFLYFKIIGNLLSKENHYY